MNDLERIVLLWLVIEIGRGKTGLSGWLWVGCAVLLILELVLGFIIDLPAMLAVLGVK